MTGRRRQAGFSLLEVLVAFAILGISLGALLQTFATGLRNAGVADEYSRATLYAESILAAIGRETPLGEGGQSGPIDDRYSWRSSVTPYVDDMPDPEITKVRAYRVGVEVFWNGASQARSVTLETLRLAPAEPQGGSR